MRRFASLALAVTTLSVPALLAQEDGGNSASEREIAELVGALSSDDYAARQEATTRLSGMAASIVEALRRGSVSEDAEVRERCTKILREIHSLTKSPRDMVFEYLFAHPSIYPGDEATRAEVAALLARIGPGGQEALLDILLDPNTEDSALFSIRQRAVDVLEIHRDDPFGVERLVAALESGDSEIRFFGIEGLLVLDRRETLERIVELLPKAAGPEGSQNEFDSVLDAAARWGDAKTLARLGELVDPAALSVRFLVSYAESLFRLGDSRGGDIVVERLDSPDSDIRLAAGDVIGNFFPYEVSRGYDPYADPESQKERVQAIREWWKANRDSYRVPREGE